MDTGKWQIGSLISLHEDIAEIFFLESLGRTNCVLVVPKTVGQSTGLIDKNDKEIYEGDIVRVTDETTRKKPFICIVEWISHVASFEAKAIDVALYIGLHNPMNEKEWIDEMKPFINMNRTIEIIGNIHDNPELLKG